jgi:predicted ATPase/DNA-binding SARP family transcriptional activator
VPAPFERPRTLASTTIPSSTLPLQLTEFIGREQELGALARVLADSRLLTLTGAGGSGKTRLALEAVVRARDADGWEVAWVELSALSDASALAAHVAVALGVRPEGGGSAEQAVVGLLRDRALLLVLDNCEHLVDACAAMVDRLLRSCPRLRVLATSREALGIAGERAWLVPPLFLPPEDGRPTPEGALESEAVRLFVERARDVAPSFGLTPANVDAVVRICRRLDGLPLALELAATRVSILGPAEIAERLEDRFGLLASGTRSALPRHRTLRAAVDWSYELLPEPARILLERLSVFAGGFTLDAAEQVCPGDPLGEADVLHLLSSLTTRSLVTMQEEEGRARYRLLETIREYAAAKRAERGGDSDVAERHATYFVAAAREAAAELLLGREHRLHQMDVEHENVRSALSWSADRSAGATVGLPLCWALMWYWFHRQLFREGFEHFGRALGTAVDPPPQLRAAALHGLGLFGLYARDPASRARLAEADALWREVGNDRWLAFTLLVRTVEASLRGDPTQARGFAEEAVSVARAVGDPWVEALTLAHALVPVLVWEGEWEEAERALTRAERTYRDHDYAIGVAYALDARAFVTLQLGEHERAVALAQASLRFDPRRENRWLAGRSLRILGAVAFAHGELGRAARLYGAADGMYRAIGAHALTEERRAVNEVPERLKQGMAAEDFAREWAAGETMSYAEALALAGAAPGEPDEPPHTEVVEAAPPSEEQPALTVRSLGALEIFAAGEPVSGEAWGYAKPRELLLYLLAHPEGRTREQIGLDFWPDASAAQVKNNFHVTLHHVRKAIGRASLIRYEQGRYRVAVEEGVDFDAARFEDHARAALRRLREAPDDKGAVEALRKAVDLHRGPFLETESVGDWHLALRDRLSRLHEEALLALGDHHQARGEHAQAAEAYRSLVARNPLHEEAVRRLVVALARDGRRAEALRVVDRLARDLATELDAEPEPETLELVARVRHGALS